MFRFEHIEVLWGLLLIPFLLLLYILYRKWRTKALERFGESKVIGQLMPDVSASRPGWKIFLQLAGLTFLILGLANPQYGTSTEEVKAQGIDLMVALDISNSMLAEDFQPNRLERAKQLIQQLLGRMDGDRFGLVLFAGEAYVQLPLTTDYPAARLFLSTVSTDLISTQGTAIGNAIDLCVQSLENAGEEGSKAILVISDGENHEDNAIEAAKKAGEKNILVLTAGIGSVDGVPIPDFYGGRRRGFKKDNNGEVVISRLNEDILKQVATATGGSYVRVSDTRLAQNHLVNEISKLETTETSQQSVTDYESHFQYLIGLALLLFTIDFFLSYRKGRFAGKFDLFGNEKQA